MSGPLVTTKHSVHDDGKGPGSFTVLDHEGNVVYQEQGTVGTWWVTERDGKFVSIVKNDQPEHPSTTPEGIRVFYDGGPELVVLRTAHGTRHCCPECGSLTRNGCGAKWHENAPDSVCSRHGWAVCPLCHPAKDRRPHARACGIGAHDHGPACSPDCPTCHGRS